MFILFAAISLQTGSGNIYTVRQRYIGNPPHGHSGGSMNLCVCVCVGRVAQAKKSLSDFLTAGALLRPVIAGRVCLQMNAARPIWPRSPRHNVSLMQPAQPNGASLRYGRLPSWVGCGSSLHYAAVGNSPHPLKSPEKEL